MSTAIAKSSVGTFATYFKQKAPAIKDMIPKHLSSERVAKIAVAALMRNPTLLQCKPETVWFCVAQAATLGLEVNLLGSAYLVPFRNNKAGGMDCQLIVGYQGLIDLARRSGNIESIEARIVYQKDEFELENGLEPVLRHKPCFDTDPGCMRLVYAVAKLKDGGKQIEYMTKKEIDSIRSRSKAKDFGPWVTDYEEMARKTVIRRIAKYLPKSIEFSQALAIDDAGDRGEPQLAGLDIETDDILAEAEANVVEESGTEKLKQKMSESKGRKTVEPTHEYKQSYAKLSLNYDEHGKKIDDLLFANGIEPPLIEISKDETDESICKVIVAIAKEF